MPSLVGCGLTMRLKFHALGIYPIRTLKDYQTPESEIAEDE
jgi:hypothetical protein